MMQSKPWNPPSVLYIVWTEENIKWECIFNLFCSHFSTLSKCHWQAGQNLVNCKNKIIKISSIIYRKIHVCQGINSYISDTKRYTINATSKGEREPSNIKLKVGKILVSVCIVGMKMDAILGYLIILVMTSAVQAQLKAGFYSTPCPNAEAIVGSTVVSHFSKDLTIAPGLLRLHFHDCFVQVS